MEKRERERKIEIDSPKKSSNSSFLAIVMLISHKPVQRIGIGEKCGFFATRRGCHQRVKEYFIFCIDDLLYLCRNSEKTRNQPS